MGLVPGMDAVCASRRGNPVIVGYHRVLPEEQYEQYPCIHADLAVTPERFREHIAYWAAHAECVNMDAVANGRLPQKAVAIGFDDFYADVAQYALPILEEFRIPAILYLCTDFVEGTPFLWWYGIDAAVNNGQHSLDISFEGQHFRGSLKKPWQRQALFRRLNAFCFRLDSAGQRAFLECLGTVEHCLQPGAQPSWAMVEELARHPLITIGAHTLNHGALQNLDTTEARRQMEASRTRIEARLGRPVRHLAYPFGGKDAARQREYALAADVGFATAVTTERGVNGPDTPLHALHRSVILQEHDTLMLRSLNSGWDNTLRMVRQSLTRMRDA